MSSSQDNQVCASVTGGFSSRPVFIVEPSSTLFLVLHNEQELAEIAAIDMAALSAKEQEEEWGPNFYHKKQDEHVKFAQSNSKVPTVVLAGGMFGFNDAGVPIMAAKLQCGTCHASKVYPGVNFMFGHLPDDCQAKKVLTDCPLYHGQMKRQYERLGY